MSDGDSDYSLKILLVGESGVGKSCVLLRYADNTFSQSFISTIGVDFKMKKITLNDRSVKLQLWDTAGQERYRTIVASFYRGAHGILLVFDVTDINSFLKVRTWLEEIKKNAPDGTAVVLVGNKSDMDSKRMVDQKEAAAFAQKHSIPYLETSAKEGTGIKEAFETLASDCLTVLINRPADNRDGRGVDLNANGGNGGWCSC